MEVYFNERCLIECPNVDSTIKFLHENLSLLEKVRIETQTNIDSFREWFDACKTEFDKTSEDYFYRLLKRFEKCEGEPTQFYYHLFVHQDYSLSISHNLVPASLTIATDKYLSKHTVAILNLKNSSYDRRPYIPILRSPHGAIFKDELVNLPSFNHALKIQRHLIKEQVKELVRPEKYENFVKEFDNIFASSSFDIENWEPKEFNKDGSLFASRAFPCTNSGIIIQEMNNWKELFKSSTEDNIALIKKISGYVCLLNGYIKNTKLTTRYQYEIYEAGYGNKKLLISLDIENGLLEVIDYNGLHLGAYDYTGTRKKFYSDPQKLEKHSFKDLPTTMFIFK